MKKLQGVVYSLFLVLAVGLLTLGVACAPQQGPGTPSSSGPGWFYDGEVLGEVIKAPNLGVGVSFTLDIQVSGNSIFDGSTDPFVGDGAGTPRGAPLNVSLPAGYDPRPQALPNLPFATIWYPLGVMEDATGTTGSFVYLRVHSMSYNSLVQVVSFLVRAADNTDLNNVGNMPLLNLDTGGTGRIEVIVRDLGMQKTPAEGGTPYANVILEVPIAGQTDTAGVLYMRHYPTGYFYDLVGAVEFLDFPVVAAPDPAGTGLSTRQVSARNFWADNGGGVTDEYEYQDLGNPAANMVDFQMTVRQPAYGAAPNIYVDPSSTTGPVMMPTGASGVGVHEISVAVSLITFSSFELP